MRTLLLWMLFLVPCQAELFRVDGQKRAVDINTLLVYDRPNIVCFFALNNQICRSLYPKIEKLAKRGDLDLHLVDVGTVNSPTAKKYSITTVPYFKMYDKKSNLTSEGSPAYKQVAEMLDKL